MSFDRLRIADWVAMIAALALLFAMATDWYSNKQGEAARRIERLTQPSGALGGEVEREVHVRARERAERAERDAWQADGAIDRVILVALIATFLSAIAAAFLRAAGRRFEPPWTPSSVTAVAATLGAALVAYRMVQEPGLDVSTTVKAGAPIALILLGVIAVASARGLAREEAGDPFREPPPTPEQPVTEGPAET